MSAPRSNSAEPDRAAAPARPASSPARVIEGPCTTNRPAPPPSAAAETSTFEPDSTTTAPVAALSATAPPSAVISFPLKLLACPLASSTAPLASTTPSSLPGPRAAIVMAPERASTVLATDTRLPSSVRRPPSSTAAAAAAGAAAADVVRVSVEKTGASDTLVSTALRVCADPPSACTRGASRVSAPATRSAPAPWVATCSLATKRVVSKPATALAPAPSTMRSACTASAPAPVADVATAAELLPNSISRALSAACGADPPSRARPRSSGVSRARRPSAGEPSVVLPIRSIDP